MDIHIYIYISLSLSTEPDFFTAPIDARLVYFGLVAHLHLFESAGRGSNCHPTS